MTSGSPWESPETVAGFVRSAPNAVLLRYAEALRRAGAASAADIGCGAGRNAIPLAADGWDVVATDLSWPMLAAARDRSRAEAGAGRLLLAHAPMESLPLMDRCADLVIAHGIWNLAVSAAQFRRAVAEAARVSRPGAALFVFTFSRNTLAPSAAPVEGETFVFTQFSGRPQVFLTGEQLVEEMQQGGFDPDPAVPLTEHNRPSPGMLRGGGPVIYEAAFRRRRARASAAASSSGTSWSRPTAPD
jgi:SAM-dependent methyltransferase